MNGKIFLICFKTIILKVFAICVTAKQKNKKNNIDSKTLLNAVKLFVGVKNKPSILSQEL